MPVVCGYDESPGAVRALAVAVEVAAAFDDTLVLVYGAAAPGSLGEEYAALPASIDASWKLETSHATQSSGSSSSATSESGTPMFPPARLLRPAASRIACSRAVVVVFPFVPVTASTGAER